MSKKKNEVSVANENLKKVLDRLRELGETTVPISIAMRMIEVQKKIISHLENVNELQNGLIARYGEETGFGHSQVGPRMNGFPAYKKDLEDLMNMEYSLGEPFVLYEKDDEFGWTEDVKVSLEITPNLIVDMEDFLVIQRNGSAPFEEGDN